VKEYKYLEYIFQRNKAQERHMREKITKTAKIMGQIWRISKRRFGGNSRKKDV